MWCYSIYHLYCDKIHSEKIFQYDVTNVFFFYHNFTCIKACQSQSPTMLKDIQVNEEKTWLIFSGMEKKTTKDNLSYRKIGMTQQRTSTTSDSLPYTSYLETL